MGRKARRGSEGWAGVAWAAAALWLLPISGEAQINPQAVSQAGSTTNVQTSSQVTAAPSTTLPLAPTPAGTPSTTSATAAGNGLPTLQGGTGGGVPVDVPNQSSLFNPYLGSIQARPAVPQVIELTLEDALHMGVENNLGLIYSKQAEVNERAQKLTVLNVLLPNIDVQGQTGIHQFNLEAEGFRPDILPELSSLLPAGTLLNFPEVVKVDVTTGQANFSQYLFDLAGFDLVKALNHLVHSTEQTTASSRGSVLENVGTAYLRVIAARSQVQFDQSLLATDAQVLYVSEQEHQAGITSNLDEVRSRVQYQTQQQSLIGDQNTLGKAKIALNRAIGLAPEQEIQVADATPFPELEAMTPEAAEGEAFASRQDYQSSLEQLRAAELEGKAAGHERYPTLIFNANYGVTGISGGIFHDTFSAVGTLNIPVFQEAKFRSDRSLTDSILMNARAQVGNLHGEIQQEISTSLIDLQADEATVAQAKSNQELSQKALELAVERFRAGVEDNLPSIEAESTLAQAQVQFISATFQYNLAKLNFAQNLGMLDVNYHPEWQGGRPAGVLSNRAAMGLPPIGR